MSGAAEPKGQPIDSPSNADMVSEDLSLADRLLGQFVITYDPDGAVNAVHAMRTEAARMELTERLLGGLWRSPTLVRLLNRLRECPDDPQAYRDALALLAAELAVGSVPSGTFLPALRDAEERGFTRYRLGALVSVSGPAVPTDVEALSRLPAPALNPSKAHAELAIVLPVRFTSDADERLRNCMAALHALNRQTADRARFRLVVVEQDVEPRGRRYLAHLADDYVFVVNPGPFNKSWALNIGVLAAERARLLCLIDADALVPPDFVSRTLERMNGGIAAELPFTELLFLDQRSTAAAIAQRLPASADGHTSVDERTMRGFTLLGVKGFCICVTREIFDKVGGYDERYTVWGDDDNEFYGQVAERTTVSRLPGAMLHLWHRRPTMVVSGMRRPNSHLIGVPRPTVRDPIGRRDKYTT